MNSLFVICIICAIAYCTISWVLPIILAWLFNRKYHVTVRVGRFAFPLSLKDIVLTTNGYTLHIENIRVRSSFFNSEVNKLLSIEVQHVRFNKDIGEPASSSHKKINIVRRISRSNSWHNERQHCRNGSKDFTRSAQNTVLDFRNKKVPHSIITFAQFMAVHVHNVSVVLHHASSPGWLLHATAEGLHLDGSIVTSARTMIVNVVLTDAQAKILRHTSKDQEGSQPCLGELSFGVSLEAMLIAQGPLAVEKLHITMNQTNAIVHEGLYSFMQENKAFQENLEAFDFQPENQDHGEMSKDVFLRTAPVIPKILMLKIDDTTLTGMRESGRAEFTSSLQSLQVNMKVSTILTIEQRPRNIVDGLAQLVVAVGLDAFKIQSSQEKLLTLKKFTLDAKLENNIVNLYLVLNTLCISYSHKDIHSWVSTNFMSSKQSKPLKGISPAKDINTNLRRTNSYNPTKTTEGLNTNDTFYSYYNNKVAKSNWLETLLSRCIVQGCAEFWSVSALIKMDQLTASLGFSHTKLILDQLTELREVSFTHTFPRLLLGQRHWSTELLVDSLWARVISPSHEPTLLKKYHRWGTPMFLGVALVKLCSHGVSGCKMEAMLDTVRAEWSPTLSEVLVQAIKCLQEYKSTTLDKRPESTDTEKPRLEVGIVEFVVNVSLSNINIFMITDNDMCIMTRLDSMSIDSSCDKTANVLCGLKMAAITQSGNNFMCNKTDDIENEFGFIKLARFDFVSSGETTEYAIKLLDTIHFQWSTSIHLRFITLTEDLKKFHHDAKVVLEAESEPEPIIDFYDLPEPSTVAKIKRNINLNLKGDIAIEICISDQHQMIISADDFTISDSIAGLCLVGLCLIINIDGSDIFTVQGLHLEQLTNSEKIRKERETHELSLSWNKTWALTIESLHACFPYKHKFSEAIQNQFMALVKWLKLVHGKVKKPFPHPLPSDLLISVKEFLFEMSDDPFEVKLRDNYELLEDEYKESLKRQNMLDAKVDELCKLRLLLPAGKVEELYANLKKVNADVYVQRSRQISKAGPARTRLFAWCLNDLEVFALADPTIHGTDNCVRVMKDIDPESPWPEEGLEFTILWCRSVNVSCREWKFLLRDFPQPMLDIYSFSLFGMLVGAEQEAPRRAKCDVVIDLGECWGQQTVQRGITSLKFYHDFNCEVDCLSLAFGPCWEPVIAQCNLAFENISTPSRDPSPPLAFWDKMRLLLHGRLTLLTQKFTVLLHASLDPYNTTEEMAVTWQGVCMDWTNAKIVFKGDFSVSVRTATKYDDCELLRLPNLKLTIKLHWICLANANDHHSVIQCAPDKVPEYSINQEHDSFRAFRSQNVNINLSLETRPVPVQPNIETYIPNLKLFGSTLRWFESLKLILSGVTRPTRRGSVFKNVRPRKPQLSRHYRKVHLLLGLHQFQVFYWMSSAMQRGFILFGDRVSSSSEHNLTLHPINDGLKHRPRAEWSTMYMNCELIETEIWLKSTLEDDFRDDEYVVPGRGGQTSGQKCFCLSVAQVSYGREAVLPPGSRGEQSNTTPTHRLVVYDLKGAWTKINRDVVFALFDTFMKNKQLKKNLSTEALKGFRCETSTTPLKSRRTVENTPTPPVNAPLQASQTATVQGAPSPMSKLQSGHAAAMLQQLIAEADNKSVVFSDDLSAQTREQQLQGLQACQDDDVLHNNWLIALVNSQVLLKGCETRGYIILSAAKAEILQRVHIPVWGDCGLVPKTTWVGSLECMQYYATVSAGEKDELYENINWLTVDNIQEKDASTISDAPDLVGSGQSVGGVVSKTVGASSAVDENSPTQLQRIVSRCKCEFFYVCYGDMTIDPDTLHEVPPLPQDEGGPWDKKERAVDAFTLMHHDLDVCTNSLQYAMILDVVNNLLLYVEPQKKQALERLARMRFQLQLHKVEDQRRPIQHLQNQVRYLVSKLRRLEKETHLIEKSLELEKDSDELQQIKQELILELYNCKEQLTCQSEELDMMLSCYKETQLSANSKLATLKNDKPVTTVRANEICFKHAQWRLTETDGQLGIADLVLSNFLYTKNSKSDDSVEHLLELGYVHMTNLIPNQIYSKVLYPTEIQSHMPVDRKRVLRVFCRERPPVGGIAVKEHFEINVVPITIGLTKKFFNTMLKFCFPERDPDLIDADVAEEVEDGGRSTSSSSITSNSTKRSRSKKGNKDTNFYIKIEQKDDVEKMKERAEKNKLFIYIKIPEVPVRVSYKGNKEKNLEDIRDFSLVIPTLEYHNVTWTWLDFLLAMKSDSRRVILSQAIKQKLQIHRNRSGGSSSNEGTSPQEEDKARILFGSRHVGGESSKSNKKGVFKFTK